MREQAVDGESVELSSVHCTVTEGELVVHLGLLDLEGDLIDWKTDLEINWPSLLSFVPAVPVQPSFVSCPQVQAGVGFDPGGQP